MRGPGAVFYFVKVYTGWDYALGASVPQGDVIIVYEGLVANDTKLVI